MEQLNPGTVNENPTMVCELIASPKKGILSLASAETFFDGTLPGIDNLKLAACLAPQRKALVGNVIDIFPFLAETREAEFLSGGQQRILSIAMLFILSPEVLVIERPWEELDEQRILGIWKMLAVRGDLCVVVDSKSK